MPARVALVTVYNPAGELLLGRRRDVQTWTMPGGHLNEGESPDEGARRELLEETGLSAETLSPLTTITRKDGLVLHCFSAYVTGTPHGHDDPDSEVEEWKFFDVSEGLPKHIASNLHGPKDVDENLLLRLFHIQKNQLFEGGTPLQKMAISSIPEGEPSHGGMFGYNHVLPEHLRDDYTLRVYSHSHGMSASVQHNDTSEEVGTLQAIRHHKKPRSMEVDVASLEDEHRGQGIGKAMYEALYRHGMKEGIKEIVGLEHTPAAHHVHVALATKHGLSYKADRKDNGKYGPYQYTLKSEEAWGEELEKMAIANIPAGAKMGDTFKGRTKFDYSHVLSPEHTAAGMRMEVHHNRVTGLDGSVNDEDLQSVLFHGTREVGGVTAKLFSDGTMRPHSMLNPEYKGKGFGRSMYEALYAHAYQVLGRDKVEGGSRSNDAHRVHNSLARRHGLDYSPKSHIDDEYGYTIKSEESLEKTDTPEFHQWFQGSHVKTPEGKPLQVYHGTSKDKDFGTFKISPRGTWFTSDPGEASQYANENDSQTSKWDHGTAGYVRVNTTPRVIPVHLSIRNPYRMSQEEFKAMDTSSGNYARAQGQRFSQLRALGHDGVIIGDKTFVAFHPHQIKSIFNKRPTAASGHISKSLLQKDARDHAYLAEHQDYQKTADHNKEKNLPHTAHLEEAFKKHHVSATATSYGTELPTGNQKKMVYRLPVEGIDEHQRFMVKPYHSSAWGKGSGGSGGWAEATSQALYHAAGIGHLHQKSFVTTHGVGKAAVPATVIHLQNGSDIDNTPTFGHAASGIVEQARKIDVMDFLTQSDDRHGGNLLLTDSGDLMAIDHGESFRYPHEPKSFHSVVNRSITSKFRTVHNGDGTRDLYSGMEPTFQWWKTVGAQVRKSFDERLGSVTNKKFSDKARESFHARADWLDKMANTPQGKWAPDWHKEKVGKPSETEK